MKRILITGASRGIGRAIAEALAGEGVTLLLHGRNEAALKETAQAVQAKGGKPIALTYDLRDRVQIGEMTAQINAEPLDVLINNAGIAVVKPYDALTADEWLETLAVNVTAPFLLTQQLAPQMSAGASIVNILSPAAKTGFPGWSSYSMSKFALEGFSQAVREELRPRGVRVINIYPSATDTDIWCGVEGNWPREKMIAANDVAAAVKYALSQPANVVVENVSVASLAGTL
jgi:short-subunit dehydrogenase